MLDTWSWVHRRPRVTGDQMAHKLGVLPRRRLLASLGGLVTAGTLHQHVQAAPDLPDVPALLAQLIERVNQERAAAGLEPLRCVAELNAAAQTHANDMAAHNFVAHSSSDGTDQFQRILRFYPYDTWLGENIGAGYTTVEALMAAWIASPPHHQNLLEPAYRAVGVGLTINPEARYGWYWTIDLGGHLDEAPPSDTGSGTGEGDTGEGGTSGDGSADGGTADAGGEGGASGETHGGEDGG